MRRSEKVIFGIIAGVVVSVFAIKALLGQFSQGPDPGVPFYSTASPELNRRGNALYNEQNCKKCHVLRATRDMTLAVPAPSLDGIGSLRDEEWLYAYFSAEDPQTILPSRLKAQYRMPSFASLPEADRRALAQYIASMKVEDWYLNEVRKAEYEKLTGKAYEPSGPVTQ
jgi:mono/diheme cytochrome c family protein